MVKTEQIESFDLFLIPKPLRSSIFWQDIHTLGDSKSTSAYWGGFLAAPFSFLIPGNDVYYIQIDGGIYFILKPSIEMVDVLSEEVLVTITVRNGQCP